MPNLDPLLKRMAEARASDLHLVPRHPPLLRVHGQMARLAEHGPLSDKDITDLVFEILPERCRQELEERLDTDFAYELAGAGRFRIHAFRDRLGLSAALRLIPDTLMSFEELGLPPVAHELCQLPKGLVLVTGPTGSGKSTTLAAMIDRINQTRQGHIITIEDPIEFVHASKGCLVHQREVGVHARSFRSALRAALREDPDVILVGEMRDLETMRSAIELAVTGHLVFGTLHTSTAAATIDRIIDQYPAQEQAQIRSMLAGALKAVLAQTLLRRRDGRGRLAAFEVLVVTAGVGNMIREGKTHAIASAIQTGAKYGMMALNDSLLELVLKGRVEAAEAYLHAVDKADLSTRFLAHGIRFDPAQLAGAALGLGAEQAEAGPAAAAGSGAGAAGQRWTRAPRPRESKKVKFDDFESFRASRLG